MSESIEIDPIQIAKDIFGLKGDRNDLAITVKNETSEGVSISFNKEHGKTAKVDPLKVIPPHGEWHLGIHAVGAGSNVCLDITYPDDFAFALIAATPVNKQNYLKLAHSDSGYPSAEAARKAANKEHKFYAEKGVLEQNVGGHQLNATISQTSRPAHCEVVISRTKTP